MEVGRGRTGDEDEGDGILEGCFGLDEGLDKGGSRERRVI